MRSRLSQLFEVFPADPSALLPLGVCCDGAVHGVGLNGRDPLTGGLPESLAGQTEGCIRKLHQLVEGAGATLDDLTSLIFYTAEASCESDVLSALLDLFREGQPCFFSHSTMTLPAGELVRFDVTAQLPDAVKVPSWLINLIEGPAVGVRAGDLIYAPALTAADSATGELPPGQEAQLRAALANMDLLLLMGGATRSNVAFVCFAMPDIGDRTLLNKVWSEWYPDPDDRPPNIYVPSPLPEGVEVALEVMAVSGATRRTLYIPGLRHGDAMSMGALTGNLVTSSRIMAGSEAREAGGDAVEAFTTSVFANLDALLQDAGGDWHNVESVVGYVSEASYGENVERHLALHVDATRAPRLELCQSFLGRDVLYPRLRLLALL